MDLSWISSRDVGLAEKLVLISLVCDSIIVVYALLGAFWLRFASHLIHVRAQETFKLGDYGTYIAVGAVSLICVLSRFDLYEKGTLLRYRFVSIQIVKACLCWFGGYLAFALAFKMNPPVSRLFVAFACGNALTGLLVWRAVFQRYLRRSSVCANLRQRILYVGWNSEAERLTQEFESDENPAYEVTGCVAPAFARLPDEIPDSIPVLGHVDDMERLISRERIDIVLLTDVDCMKGDIVHLANVCEKEMVQFKIIPSYFQILVSGLELQTVNGIPVLGVTQLPLDRFPNTLIKRTIDIAGALVGLALSAPIMALFGGLVYRESPGPILYRQRRLGRGGMPFDIIKIRSMRLDAEKEGTGWSTKDDPRRLKIGAFMRKWNIDELPQFWNVLKGEMSLVGPRPERPELIASFKEDVPHYNARHNARPGMTGWAQVKGFRGDTDLTERVRCDLFYLENWNTLLDMQIMLMTLISNKSAC